MIKKLIVSLLFVLFICTYVVAQPISAPVGVSDEGGAVSRPVLVIDCAGDNVVCTHSSNTMTITVSGSVSETNSLETLTTGILADEVPVGTTADTVVFKAVPDCDTAGKCLNYDTTAHAWSCKTIADGDVPDDITVDVSGNVSCAECLIIGTEVKAGTLTDTKYCIWDTANSQIVCDSTPAGSGDLLADGTVPLTANWDVGAFNIHALTFTSDQATGTAPFTVASTTEVANLKAATATVLAANGANCNAGEYALGVDASGAVESCTDATTEINSVVNGLGGTNLTCSGQSCNVDNPVAGASTVTNATFTTALTVNTGTLTLTADAGNDSVLTIGGGAVSVSGANTGDQTINTGDIADVSVTQTELAELETIGATTISANQWAALGGIAETLGSAELNLLDGIVTLSGSNTGDDSGTDDQTAAEVSIADAGSIITAVEVEAALQENRTAIDLNTAKNTNVSTALSVGTVGINTVAITSDGGADDVTLPAATVATAGMLTTAKWAEVVANNAKVTNTDTQDLGISGNDVTLVDGGTADISTTTAVGLNTAKITNATHTGEIIGSTALTISGVKKRVYLSCTAGIPRTTGGCADAALSETSTNKINYYTCDFDASTDEHWQSHFTLPENYTDAGTFTYAVSWTGTADAAKGVAWFVQMVCLANDEALDVAFGTAIESNDDGTATGDYLLSPESAAVTAAGSCVGGEELYIQLYRDVSDADDDLTTDAKMIGLWLTFPVNKLSTED